MCGGRNYGVLPALPELFFSDNTLFMFRLLFCLLPFFLSAVSPAQPVDADPPKIIRKPIRYDAERVKLSIEYLKTRHGLVQTTPSIRPKMIVLHFTGSGTAQSVHAYFNPSQIEQGRQYNRTESLLNVSSQYLVDRDGTIFQLMYDTLFARHTIGLNYCAIGIENVGGPSSPLTEKQVMANVALVRHLCMKYPEIEYLIGHSEYLRFRNKSIWKETDPNYITYKTDPGDGFLAKVRERLKNYPLRDRP
jgi:N-acetylmuramoyl-L-alanine amidase